MPLTALVRHPADAPTFVVTGVSYSLLLRGEECDDRLSAAIVTVPPDMGPPAHIHDHEDQYYFVVRGEIDFLLGSDRRLTKPGDFVFAPRAVPHAFMNRTDRDATMLVLTTPGILEKQLPETGRLVLPGSAGAGETFTEEDAARMRAACERFGVRFVF